MRELPEALVCEDDVLGMFLYFGLLALLMDCATGPVHTFSKSALSEYLAVNSGSMAGSGYDCVAGGD